MRSWLVKELADPDKALNLEETSVPTIEPGKVLIKVEAAALNFFDILYCQGKYQEKPPLPFTPGAEVSGTIQEVSEGSRFQVGLRVMAKPQVPNGGLCEYVAVNEDSVYEIPDSLGWGEAASMLVTYHTTYYALFQRAMLKKGETLLVHAGAGGVGSAAIQLGKAVGATVIATAGGTEKKEICLELGADFAIDYLTEDFVEIVKQVTDGKGADVIYDSVGGDTFDRSKKCIAFDGRLLVIGFASGRIPEIAVNHVLVKNYSLVGVHWGLYRRMFPQGVIDNHKQLMKWVDEGKVKPLIYKEYPFEDVPYALNLLGSRKTWGKLVVKP